MSRPEWMPENPCPCGCIRHPDSHKCNAEDFDCIDLAKYEARQGTAKAILKWLEEPCICHTCWGVEFNAEIHYKHERDGLPMPLHRYLCPECMAQFIQDVATQAEVDKC